MDSLSDEELRAEMRRAGLLANLCAERGEVDGEQAMRSLQRAIFSELAVRGSTK